MKRTYIDACCPKQRAEMLNLWTRAAAILLALGTTAYAQQSRHSLQSENNALITSNGHNGVTGPVVNSMFNGVIISAGMLNDANTWLGPNTFSGSVMFADPASVRANLGAAASGANGDITSFGNLNSAYFNDITAPSAPASGGYLASVNGVMTWVSPSYTSALFGGKYSGDATRPWILNPIGIGYNFSTGGTQRPNLRLQRQDTVTGSVNEGGILSTLHTVGNGVTSAVTSVTLQTTCNSVANGAGLCNPAQIEGDRGTVPVTGGATFTNGSAVIGWSGSTALLADQQVAFTTTGGLPSGFSTGSAYFVLATGLTSSTFQLSATAGGSAIVAGSAGSGTHTAALLFQSPLFGLNVVSKDQSGRKSSLSGAQVGYEGDVVRAGPDDSGIVVILDIIGREQFGPSPDGATTITHGVRTRPSDNFGATGPVTIIRGFEATSSTAYPGASVTYGLWSDSASYGAFLTSSAGSAKTTATAAAGTNTLKFSNAKTDAGHLSGVKVGDLVCENVDCSSPVNIPAGTTVQTITNLAAVTTLTLSGNLVASGIASGATVYAAASYVDGENYSGNYSDAVARWASQFGTELVGINGLQIGAPTGGAKGVGSVNLAAGLYANGAAVVTSSGALDISATTPTVAAAHVGYGKTTVAAGSGTCPTGTVGGQTVQGCLQINVGGTTRNLPFF